MRVSRIALSGFRNYEWESFTFDPGTNVIRGKNGQGKTNLLEAVFMLTGGKSFRTRFDREIVGFGFSSAEILADVEAAGREQTVKITLAPGQRKQITCQLREKERLGARGDHDRRAVLRRTTWRWCARGRRCAGG